MALPVVLKTYTSPLAAATTAGSIRTGTGGLAVGEGWGGVGA